MEGFDFVYGNGFSPEVEGHVQTQGAGELGVGEDKNLKLFPRNLKEKCNDFTLLHPELKFDDWNGVPARPNTFSSDGL